MFANILPEAEDIKLSLPGDDLIQNPTAVIDSAFDLPGTPLEVFPWFLQLGKRRAGWYFPRRVERFIPHSKRGLRYIESKWQKLEVGQRIPDYGGKNGYLDCFYLEANKAIGYTSKRGNITMTWVLTFWPAEEHSRVVIRLRIKTSKRSPSFLTKFGKVFDRLTIAGLAAGLKERLVSN
jgi:hypothetical protein